MTVQYRESDLAFLKRLLAEEGLFCWFEHQADAGETLGSHTLIIADANSAFTANSQPRIRFTQAGATLNEDALDRWHGLRQLDTTETHAASWDYRSLSTRPQSAISAIDSGSHPKTAAWHDPGQYAWQNSAHGERMLLNQRQAIDARLKQFDGQGTVRSAAPGTIFTLADHPEHDRDDPEQRHFLITAVTHEARSPTSRERPRQAVGAGEAGQSHGRLLPQHPHRHPFRHPLETADERRSMAGAIHPRPTASGTLTAMVVGEGGSPTHTDRDGRIRVQFPWQRGQDAGARQDHPTGSNNAPANASLGVWLRVMAPVAGANWGGHLIPRPGQEVLVAFQNGNIDRPIVVGTAYNGSGNPDAQGNRVAGGSHANQRQCPSLVRRPRRTAPTPTTPASPASRANNCPPARAGRAATTNSSSTTPPAKHASNSAPPNTKAPCNSATSNNKPTMPG